MKSVSFGVILLQTNTNTPIQTNPLCSDCFRALHVHETAEISGQAAWNGNKFQTTKVGIFI
jgi:hypothetical protein